MDRRGQSGQAIVLIAIMLTVLIGMTAIAIDGSRAYALRRALQDAVDSAALAAADNLQRTGSYVTAEQAATSLFGRNMALYTAPSCSPGYGTPGAGAWTVTCTYPDGTVLTDVARALGPQGGLFQLSATRSLKLQFGRVLTNGSNPSLGASSAGAVNNLLYTPALAALDGGGCAGSSGTAISVNGTGTLSVVGDVVANGSVSVAGGALRVAGDVYSHCQASIGGVSTACYPSSAGSPCTFPDVAGAIRSGYRLTAPSFAGPGVLGAGQAFPGSSVVVPAGIYTSQPVLNGDHCWFLSGGVYTFQLGAINTGDFVSNELKPPDEPDPSNYTVRAVTQFWNSAGVNCAGGFQVTKLTGSRDLPTGQWGVELTSVRSDTYNGVTYTRESAPSMCRFVTLNNHFDDIRLDISNVPGATSYNVYASPPPNGCSGPFGFAVNVPVSGSVTNTNTNPCPLYTGAGCSLGNEGLLLTSQIDSPFAPNAAAAPGTMGAYPPASERAPIAAGLPNQNPARAAGAAGDRANENSCKSAANAYVTCPGAVTPGAVELNFPAGACLTSGSLGDTYVFSGYQYDWVSVYQPPSNACSNSLGGVSNSAFIGLIYCPSASIAITSQYAFAAAGTGGVIADTISFTGALPSIAFSSSYAPVPPASLLTG